MQLYYNTNGFPHHDLDDVVAILKEQGYDGIALTPDVHHLNPWTATLADIEAFRRLCEGHGLGITIESGARFVLDPRRKHEPNLLSLEGHEKRAEYLCRLVDMAEALRSPRVSIWSGAATDSALSFDDAILLLAQRLRPVLEYARARGVRIVFEPEPGMLVDTIAKYRILQHAVAPLELPLTIDLGHLAVTETTPYEAHLNANADSLELVHADDAKVGKHEHLVFGQGDLDFPRLRAALAKIGFTGPIAVELSRHGHDAVAVAKSALRFLRDAGF